MRGPGPWYLVAWYDAACDGDGNEVYVPRRAVNLSRADAVNFYSRLLSRPEVDTAEVRVQATYHTEAD